MDDGDPAAVRIPQHTVVVEIWEFPKTRATILGVPIRRTIIFWGLYLGPLFSENTIHVLRDGADFLHPQLDPLKCCQLFDQFYRTCCAANVHLVMEDGQT